MNIMRAHVDVVIRANVHAGEGHMLSAFGLFCTFVLPLV